MNFSCENIENDNLRATFQPNGQSNKAKKTTKRTFFTSNTDNETVITICGFCNKAPGKKSARWVKCDECHKWFHISCAGVNKSHFDVLDNDFNIGWTCKVCRRGKSIMDNSNVSCADTGDISCTWGVKTTLSQISTTMDTCYNSIVKWKKNFFLLPRGNSGKHFIVELTRLINLYNNDTVLKAVSLKSVMIFLPLMLQKLRNPQKTQRLEITSSTSLKD